MIQFPPRRLPDGTRISELPAAEAQVRAKPLPERVPQVKFGSGRNGSRIGGLLTPRALRVAKVQRVQRLQRFECRETVRPGFQDG